MNGLFIVLGWAAVLIVGLVVWGSGVGDDPYRYQREEKPKRENWALMLPGIVMTLVGAIGFITVVIMWPSFYFSSLGTTNELQAFYESNVTAYEYAIVRTEEVEINASSPGLVDVAYEGQGGTYSERIREFRDKVSWYNTELEKLRGQKGTVFGVFMVGIPDELKPIRLVVEDEEQR